MDYRTIFESDYPGAKAFTQSCLEPVFGPVQKAEHHLNDGLSEADRAIVKDIFIFGVSNNFIFGEMNFFDVTVQDKVDIERNRVTIQRAVRKSLDSYQAAIVIFHHEGNRGLWRFSFIHKGAGTGDATSAKRYSYLCGQGRFCRTLAERFQALEGIAEKKSIEQMATIFSIEALTKDFFTRLFKWYDTWAADTVRFPIGNGKNARLPKTLDESMKKENRRHLIRLITRLVFVWFIKQKIPALDWVFDKDEIKGILAPFDPQSGKEGNYYNGILQNLFFATLNKPINERCFAERDEQARKGDYGIKTKYRDFNAKSLFSDDYDSVPFPLKFKERFDAVPFLNGGLFECLDDFDSKEYRDGFSREKDRAAFVPNCLFWGDGAGASGGREGLLEIFAQYNFTIEENTPQDIEVALDPELLGKVFENLLGTFNEETSATARKESGAFYTPREIVDYMVDASLKEYLKGKLLLGKEKSRQLSLATPRSKACGFSAAPSAGDGILNDAPSAVPDNGVEKKLNTLFDYHEERHSFSADEVSVLIQAINDCKILDPACGSGAFPMGVLHKLTFILGKLDPDNKLWKEKQLEKADSLDDPAIREKVKGEIESAFKNNELGYGRKLFLIENCIYGVDIQPIAIQISKLRFFISLMVDQKIGGTKENNYHVLPLPNLETKFVAANTLIGVKREEHLVLVDSDIENLQNKLLAVRHKHFSVRDAKEKIALRKQDSVLSQCLGDMLKKNRFCNPVDAQKMADWNPYDQNTSSPFFDPWWMFGVNGFDVVLGNPPYVEHKRLRELATLIKNDYEVYSGTADLSVYFIEKGFQLCKVNGFLTYIITNKFFNTEYGRRVREFLLNYQFRFFINFEQVAIFENALVSTTIFGISVTSKIEDNFIHQYYYQLKHDEFISQFAFDCRAGFGTYKQSALSVAEWSFSDSVELAIKEKIEFQNKRIGGLEGVSVFRGVTTGYNPAFIVDRETKEVLIAADSKNKEIIKPMLQGRNIRKWAYVESNNSLIFTKQGINIKLYPAIQYHLQQFYPYLKPRKIGEKNIGRKPGGYNWYEIQDNTAYYPEFEKEKIIWGLTADKWAFAYDNKKHYLPSNGYILTSAEVPIKYLLALLNSNVLKYYFSFIGVMTAGGAYTLKHGTIQALPIKIANNYKPFIDLVDKILAAKAADSKADTTALEQQIDNMVYRLYGLTAEEIKIVERDV